MRKIVFLLVTLLVLLSCNNGKSRFLFSVHETDFVNKSKITVKATRADVDLPLGVSDLALCDSFFIVMFYNGGPLMNVYSLEWDLLGRFCYKGRAKNEFLDVPRMLSRQTLKGENGNILIPLREGFSSLSSNIKVLDLQQSLQSQKTTIVMEKPFYPYTMAKSGGEEGYYIFPRTFDFVYLNNDINQIFRANSMFNDKDGALYGRDYEVMDDSIQKKYFKMLSHDFPEDFDYVGGQLYKHPSRNLIIEPLMYMDYILFFDLDNDTTFAIHQKGSLSFDDKLSPVVYTTITNLAGDEETMDPRPIHFANFAATESFFMVYYGAGDYTINQPDPMNAAPELLFFDWDGNFLKSVMMDVCVSDIVYDEKSHTLYGLDHSNECVLGFDLSEVVADIK